MQEENLNLDYHKKRLAIKALSDNKTMELAAQKLGISKDALKKMKADYNIPSRLYQIKKYEKIKV